MVQSSKLILLNAVIVIGAIIAYVYYVNKDKLKRSGQAEWAKKRKIHNKYVFYNNNVLLRKRFRRIVMRFSSMSCYDLEKLQEESVKLFERAVKVSVLMPIVSLMLLQDVILSVLVAFVGYIYYDITVDKEIDKIYHKIMKEVSNNIQSIRERYMETENIPTAVLRSDKGLYLEKPIEQIYEILTDVEGEEKLYEFCRTSPIRMIKTLAMTCFIVNTSGDDRRDDGTTAFSEEMTSLRQEADTEIRRLEKTRIAFKSLAALALVGLACTPIADMFLLNQIPGTSLLIKGMYGQIEKTVIIGITILAYYVISIMNRPSVVNQTDKVEWIDNLSKNKKIKTWLQNIIPKKFKTRWKLDMLIKDSLSSKTMEYIYLSKVIYSAIAYVTTLVFLICFVITAKSYLWNNHKSLSFIPISGGMTERTHQQIVKLDYEYMTSPEKLSNEDTYNLVKARVRGLKELDYRNHAERLSTKWDKYYGMGFKWYFFLIAYAVAVGAWFTPELSLKFRKVLVQYESVEDVMQLQTMMIVLSNTKMDVFKTLYWLEKQSTIHKAPLRYAYHEFTSDPEGAIERLFRSVNSLDFKRLISKLNSAIYNLSLSDAFSDMVMDKEQSLMIREMLQDETLESKKQWAKLIASAPIGLTLVFGFMAPILILGIVKLVTTFSELKGLG